MRSVTLYRGLLRASFAGALVYRGQLVIFLVGALFPLIMMSAWLSLIGDAGLVSGWSKADTVSYYIGVAVVNHFTYSLLVEHWEDEVRTGSLNVQLMRPVHPIHRHVAEHIAERAVPGAVLVPVAILFSWLIPAVDYTNSAGLWALTVLAVVLGSVLGFLIGAVFTALSFWTTRVGHIDMLVWGMGTFVSGWIAPIALFPPAIRDVATLLPFHAMLGFPVELAMGKLDGSQIMTGFGVALSWIAVCGLLYALLWRIGAPKYEALGG
ncbi:ABC transporter permease [Catelliglobosispora koreensis]|uniref:ABC transporter permease n=1 Tax=Catelliglobosispora koreensis TaxID=129052 RepID=UPI00037B0CED|nr:ABC-2 family transporter protein [Catelliglobosispora koreensis]